MKEIDNSDNNKKKKHPFLQCINDEYIAVARTKTLLITFYYIIVLPNLLLLISTKREMSIVVIPQNRAPLIDQII